jgi:hypothetical protein
VARSDLDLLKRLVTFPGFDVNRRYYDNTTLAMHASTPELFEFLVTFPGAHLWIKSHCGHDLLSLSIRKRQPRMTSLLLESFMGGSLKPYFFSAISLDEAEGVRLFLKKDISLLSAKDSQMRSPLQLAATSPQVMRLLLKVTEAISLALD